LKKYLSLKIVNYPNNNVMTVVIDKKYDRKKIKQKYKIDIIELV
jgi:hypothetical protein